MNKEENLKFCLKIINQSGRTHGVPLKYRQILKDHLIYRYEEKDFTTFTELISFTHGLLSGGGLVYNCFIPPEEEKPKKKKKKKNVSTSK